MSKYFRIAKKLNEKYSMEEFQFEKKLSAEQVNQILDFIDESEDLDIYDGDDYVQCESKSAKGKNFYEFALNSKDKKLYFDKIPKEIEEIIR